MADDDKDEAAQQRAEAAPESDPREPGKKSPEGRHPGNQDQLDEQDDAERSGPGGPDEGSPGD